MTVKKIFIFLCLIILLCAAKMAYDKYSGPTTAVSREQDESAKLKQLEADLLRARQAGSTDYKSPASARMSKAKIDRTTRKGST